MLRGNSTSSHERSDRLGLGPHLVGQHLDLHGRGLDICRQLGEGGFSFVYLVRGRATADGGGEAANGTAAPPAAEDRRTPRRPPPGGDMVLKITAVHRRDQRERAEREARLLQSLSHPSIVEVYDHGFRAPGGADGTAPAPSQPAQHLILMEHCEGGTAFDALRRRGTATASGAAAPAPPGSPGAAAGVFDLPSLVISFGQICNAVSYLHAQRPPVVHRDLKPVNFLIQRGAYKLCDFGSAVVGHTDLGTPERRREAEEAISKTTTQMFRAPEMVDLYMAKRLTQSTDVWALGCCLYSLAFGKDCFEEGSNLAILSRKYRIPDDQPYGPGLAELIDRMLIDNYKERADMSEVIVCLSALYSGRPLPQRRRAGRTRDKGKGAVKTGAYRTDGQGIRRERGPATATKKKAASGSKKLHPDSAAAKRKKASEGQARQRHGPTPGGSGGSSGATSPSLTPPALGDCDDFASFDRAFEGGCRDAGAGDAGGAALPAAFEERCQVAAAPAAWSDPVDDTFEDAFEDAFRGTAGGAPAPGDAFDDGRDGPSDLGDLGDEI